MLQHLDKRKAAAVSSLFHGDGLQVAEYIIFFFFGYIAGKEVKAAYLAGFD